MKKDSRDEMIKATAYLLQTKGYTGTGLNDIVKKSGASKGSIYHYFPNGKEQLAVEAINWTTKIVTEFTEKELDKHDNAILAIKNCILKNAERFEKGTYFQGAPISAVLLEAPGSSKEISQACYDFFESYSGEFYKKLKKGGFPDTEAKKKSQLINVVIQGAFLISSSKKDASAFINVAYNIEKILNN